MTKYKVLRVYKDNNDVLVDSLKTSLALLKLRGIHTDKDKDSYIFLVSSIAHLTDN